VKVVISICHNKVEQSGLSLWSRRS